MDSPTPIVMPSAGATATLVVPMQTSRTSYMDIFSTFAITPFYYLLWTVYMVIVIPLLWILSWIIAPLAWIAQVVLNVLTLPYRIYLKFEALFIYLAIAGLIGAVAGLAIYLLSKFANQMLHLDRYDNDEEFEDQESEQGPYSGSGVGMQGYASGAQRTVADFRAARKKRKEELLEEDNKLRWLPISGQAHLVPLVKEARKGSIDDRTAMPLTHETILEVDSSTDLDFG